VPDAATRDLCGIDWVLLLKCGYDFSLVEKARAVNGLPTDDYIQRSVAENNTPLSVADADDCSFQVYTDAMNTDVVCYVTTDGSRKIGRAISGDQLKGMRHDRCKGESDARRRLPKNVAEC
jgi:hypothetical protein